MKLAYSIFYTRDLERIVDFYKNRIGLEFAFGDPRFAAFKIGKSLLGIKVSELDREVPGHQTAILEVDDVASWYSTAQNDQWNIFSKLSEEDWGYNFSILDPDSNRLEFFSQSVK